MREADDNIFIQTIDIDLNFEHARRFIFLFAPVSKRMFHSEKLEGKQCEKKSYIILIPRLTCLRPRVSMGDVSRTSSYMIVAFYAYVDGFESRLSSRPISSVG